MVQEDKHSPLQAAMDSVPSNRADPLAHVPTHDSLQKKLGELLSESTENSAPATLALLQLENFYEIRTWVGNSESNLLLSDIARFIDKGLPPESLIYRCEHFEFALILFNESSTNCRVVTSRLRQSLRSATSMSIPPQLELKCGIGLAEIHLQMPSIDALLARARLDLRRSHYGFHRESLAMNSLSSGEYDSRTALTRLREALAQQGLQLEFQPIVALKEDGLQHYEVRCALPGSARERLSITALFETAQQNALGVEIDRWVISRVCTELKKARQSKLVFTVQLTQNSIVSTQFFEWLEQELLTLPSASEQLVIQLSEIDVLISQHHMQTVSDRIANMGLRLCISNFGCTENPFRYLSLLHTQFIKLDVTQLERIRKEPARLESLRRTVAALHDQGIRVIAAMVEEMLLLPVLWQVRVNYVQGYCLQRPSPGRSYPFLKDEVLGIDSGPGRPKPLAHIGVH